MCRAEEDLKNVNSSVESDKKENKVKTENVVSKVKETKPEPAPNEVDNNEPSTDWDENIPF